MRTQKIAVVFDTNSYRQLVTGKTTEDVLNKISEIKRLESSKKIDAFGAMIVGMEMLSNLVEGEKGLNYKDCLNGVIAMSNHCYDDSQKMPKIIPQPYLHISRAFFNTVPADIELKAKNLGGVINDFKIDYQKAIDYHNSLGTFNVIKTYVDKEETTFSVDITKLIDGAKQEIIKIHPNIAPKQLREKLLSLIDEKFEPINSLAIIHAVAQTLNIQLTLEECIQKAFSMNLEFPLSVGFYRWISHKIVSENIDMQSKTSKEKRWNWIWDYHVSFLISDNTIDNKEVVLVTSDKDLVQMLSDFGYQNKVLNITDYLMYLKS